MRKTALGHSVQPRLVAFFEEKVQLHKVEELGDDISDNAELRSLLESLRRASNIFSNIKLSALLQRMHLATTKINAKDVLTKLMTCVAGAPESFGDRVADATFFGDLARCMPMANTSILITETNDKETIIPLILRMGEFALKEWGLHTDVDEFSRVLLLVRDHIAIEGVDELKQSLNEQYVEARHHLFMFKAIFELRKALAEYQSSGIIAQARVEAPGSEKLIKTTIAAYKAITHSSHAARSVEIAETEDLIALRKNAETTIEDHKVCLTQSATKPVMSELDNLRRVAHGQGPDGKDWRDPDVVPSDCAWEHLEKHAQHSLFAVNKTLLLAAIRSTAVSFVKLEEAYKVFGLKAPSDVSTEVHKLVSVARRTVVEYLFVQALLLHSSNPADAIEEIKKQSKSLSGVNLKLSSRDIHPCIWDSAQKVLNGASFRAVY